MKRRATPAPQLGLFELAQPAPAAAAVAHNAAPVREREAVPVDYLEAPAAEVVHPPSSIYRRVVDRLNAIARGDRGAR